jgi:prepilin-type N-terminal cleavage/methylation domain-containing protein
MDMTRRAFTLVELLVVIAIIGLLSTIAIISTSGSRDKARIASGVSFERSMHEAMGAALVAQYDFEEGSGAVAGDSSGNGNNATLSGAPTWTTDTYGVGSKYSMTFSGTNYVAPAKAFGVGSGNFTIALWIKTLSVSGQQYVVGNDAAGNGYRFGLGSGQIAFLIGNGAANTEANCGSQKANDGKWHHIAGVFSRTGLSFTCYMDGRALSTIVLPLAYSGAADAAARIGTSYCCALSFAGQLDNVRVYAQDLSLSDINSIYNETKDRFAFANAEVALLGKNKAGGT